MGRWYLLMQKQTAGKHGAGGYETVEENVSVFGNYLIMDHGHSKGPRIYYSDTLLVDPPNADEGGNWPWGPSDGDSD